MWCPNRHGFAPYLSQSYQVETKLSVLVLSCSSTAVPQAPSFLPLHLRTWGITTLLSPPEWHDCMLSLTNWRPCKSWMQPQTLDIECLNYHTAHWHGWSAPTGYQTPGADDLQSADDLNHEWLLKEGNRQARSKLSKARKIGISLNGQSIFQPVYPYPPIWIYAPVILP